MLWWIVAPDTISAHDVSIKILRRIRAEHSCPHHKFFKKCAVRHVPSCFWVLWPSFLSFHDLQISNSKVRHADAVSATLADARPQVRVAALVALFHLDASDLDFQAGTRHAVGACHTKDEAWGDWVGSFFVYTHEIIYCKHILLYIYICIRISMYKPVVPHKAVAEVSKIGNL